jgi:ferredoxin
MGWEPRYSEQEIREAVESSPSLTAALRLLGLRPAGGNHKTLKRHIAHYGISTEHFDPNWVLRGPRPRAAIPLEQILVENSNYSRRYLKRRLYDAGLKARACELCGQGETWRGRSMSLILDHVNGMATDNRIENLQIVCPNCAATLDTHCGRKNRIHLQPRPCEHCGEEFTPKYWTQRYCSQACGVHSKGSRDPRPERRKVDRPPHEQLLGEVANLGYSAVGRKYGVSDNAVRKWIRWYEARRPEAQGQQPQNLEDAA